MKEINMFCYQCQETAGCTGCTVKGVCGKTPEVARIQDLLVYVTKGISEVTTKLRTEGKTISKEDNHLITLNLFTTITNANFDFDVFVQRIYNTLDAKKRLIAQLDDASSLSPVALWDERNVNVMDEKARTVGVLATENEDIRSLRELTIYGLKGLSAYSKHANMLD
ncbi:MAG: hydroxylamine reductase, partial [Peptostreptococcus stomatis]